VNALRILLLALALSVGSPPPAVAQAGADLLAGIESGLQTCIRHFGNAKALRQTFIANGWKPEPGSPVFFYRTANQSLIAAHSRPKAREHVCGVSARNLTMGQAEKIARATMKQLGGFRPHPTEERLWTGALNGTEVWLGYTVEMGGPLFEAPVIIFSTPTNLK
jgi:hypothetical protein